MKNKNNIILIAITLTVLLSIIFFAAYAFLSVGNLNTTNVTNVTATSERNNMVFDTIGGAMSLNVTASSMSQAGTNNIASQNNTTLTVNFQANTSDNIVCTYDIIFEWTSNQKYQAHTNGVSVNEFTIGAQLTPNSHVTEGINYINPERDLSIAVGNQTSAVVVTGAQIDSTGTSTGVAVWNLTSKFYNVDANQNDLSNKTYEGKFKIANVSCSIGSIKKTLVDYLKTDAPKSGTSAVGSSSWVLNEDHPGEWRYAGKNPDNYISFNGELWRIIGVMTNMEYCIGTVTNNECNNSKTSSLVKIIRNVSEGKAAWNSTLSNNWLSASLKNTLQGKSYASNTNIAIAKWSLYGINSSYSTPANGSANVLYNRERNINNLGLVYSGNSDHWYGKVGLMYPSDYGYSTNGGTTYTRDSCINTSAYTWGNSDAYNTDCAANGWVRYNSVTSSDPSSPAANWFLTPGGERNDYVTVIKASGQLNRNSTTGSSTYYVKPALYLKAETYFAGGTGKWDDPYIFQ